MSKYTVIHKQTEQVTEDEWKYKTYALEVDENTRIGDIETWIQAKLGGQKVRSFEVVRLEDLKP